MNGFIKEQEFLKVLHEQLNDELIAVAEPFVQEAIKNYERALRRRLGEMVIGMIEQSYSAERMGPNLIITVRNA